MSWVSVAKKDFQDAVRSKVVLGLTVLFVLFAGGLSLYLTAQTTNGSTGGTSMVSIILPMSASSSRFVPIVGLIAACKSIVGERESGSLKILLGLPHTRFDVMIGKLVGRSLVVSIAIVIGYVAGTVPFLLFFSISPSEFFVLLLMTVLLGIVFVSIAIAFSTAMRSARRALYGAVGLYVLFDWLWERIPWFVVYIHNGLQSPERLNMPDWMTFLNMLNPQVAYTYAISYLSPSPTSAGITVVANEPFLQAWVGFPILAFWMTVPLCLAYYRFYTTDLG